MDKVKHIFYSVATVLIIIMIPILFSFSKTEPSASSESTPLNHQNHAIKNTPYEFIVAGNNPPDLPVLVAPAHLSTGNNTGLNLSVTVSDPDQDNLKVTFYGRKKLSAQDDFTIVGLPDTQYYTGELYDGSPEIFYSQTQWVVDNMATENIVFVSHFGDCVENGDDVEAEWEKAETAFLTIEDPITTKLEDGIPYAIAVGNHDQTPWGDPAGTTTFYNEYFGEDRFLGRQYYGGHYGSNNDNSYQFFKHAEMDFIVIHLEYDLAASPEAIEWADNLLTTYSNHRAIIVTHFLIGPGNPGIFGPQGQAIYTELKDHENLFLMLGGHFPGEGQRTDTYDGKTVHTLLADYQNRPFGGNGWMRIMKFSPLTNSISVKTYSPWLDEWEEDIDSEFTLNYNMENAGYKDLGNQSDIPSGTQAEINWPDLDSNTEYEWYVVVDDGTNQVTGPLYSFTTGDHQLDLTVYLEGPFKDDVMQNTLGSNLPLLQPYSSLPWQYTGDESIDEIPVDAVDWILVELRDAADPSEAISETVVHRVAAMVKTDGSIKSIDGEFIKFPTHVTDNLYVVLWHRNHLGVMSANALINADGIFIYDFTSGTNKYYGGNDACNQLSTVAWGMIAGDSDANNTIEQEDYQNWLLQAGLSGYITEDNNLDLNVNNIDKNESWLKNLGKVSIVPE